MSGGSAIKPVVVIIVAFGNAAEVLRCVSALCRSTFQVFEIVIVENKGAADFEALCSALAGIARQGHTSPLRTAVRVCAAEGRSKRCWQARLVSGQLVYVIESRTNFGYGGGVNLALRAIRGSEDWRGVWILNPDTVPEPSALEHVIHYSEQGGYDLTGCRLVENGRIQSRGGVWHRLLGRGKSIGYGDPMEKSIEPSEVERELEWISGAACYATRRFTQEVGLMSEEFFLYCEDVEWSLRRGRSRLGYAHDAVVHHALGTTIGSSGAIAKRSDLSIYLAQRNPLLLTRECFPLIFPLVALTTLLFSAEYLVRGSAAAFIVACRGWWAGISGETGPPMRYRANQPDPVPPL